MKFHIMVTLINGMSTGVMEDVDVTLSSDTCLWKSVKYLAEIGRLGLEMLSWMCLF